MLLTKWKLCLCRNFRIHAQFLDQRLKSPSFRPVLRAQNCFKTTTKYSYQGMIFVTISCQGVCCKPVCVFFRSEMQSIRISMGLSEFWLCRPMLLLDHAVTSRGCQTASRHNREHRTQASGGAAQYGCSHLYHSLGILLACPDFKGGARSDSKHCNVSRERAIVL